MKTSNSILYQGKNSIIECLSEGKILKRFNQEFPTEACIQRFQNEYNILQNLELDGVRKVIDYQKKGNTHALILEYIEGKELINYLREHSLTFIEKLGLLLQLTQIIGQVHQAGIIHKDLNPNNILLTEEGKVYLIDFGISSKFTLKQPNLGNPEGLEGTLSYISPEQTGRMNRSVDYRTDLYALGVIFYQVLANQLPFISSDSMALVYAHIAEMPAPPKEINPEIPNLISELILKLLAKNPEDRYQSALGIAHDLTKYLTCLEQGDNNPNFSLAKNDFSGKLQIPEKLYGREKEIKIILEAFNHVLRGSVELTLVVGYSGTGKSVLASETHRLLASTKGYFVEGKFDQFQRNIPFSAWIQAFQNFIDLLLTENEETLNYWKTAILEALGDNGGVLTEVIPNLEAVIGNQPKPAEIGGQEAQNRFNYVIQNFIKAITNEKHPLIIFIDDLQWADLASLNLLKTLVTDQENTHLLCVGAYRDNEVSATHPLALTLKEIEQETYKVNKITVGNLNSEAVLDLLADTLNYKKDKDLALLNHILLSKTQGNAFFTHQFLKHLYETELLRFDFKSKKWTWQNRKIEQEDLTDNVVEFMAQKVTSLSENIRKLLEFAACIGNKFKLNTLEIIIQNTDLQTHLKNDLETAILEGLILPTQKGSYQFVHDRIQQAAYSLISQQKKQAIHLKIGQLLSHSLPKEEREERIFDITNHYNLATDIFEEKDREIALILNQEASQKAQGSASFDGMLTYIQKAKNLLPKNSWKTDYDTTLNVYKTLVEAEFLNTNYDTTKQYVAEIVGNAQDIIDKAEAMALLSKQSIVQGQFRESIEQGFFLLSLLGIEKPQNDLEAVQQYFFHDVLAKTRKIMDETGLENLPVNTSREVILMIEILELLAGATYIIGDMLLFQFCCAKGVELSLKYGNASSSPKHYVNSSIFISAFLGDYKDGYKLAESAYNLAQESNSGMIAKVSISFANWQSHWANHLKHGKSIVLDGLQKGLEMGEIEFAMYNVFCYFCGLFAEGVSLRYIKKELEEKYWALSLKYYNTLNVQILVALRWNISALEETQLETINDSVEEFDEKGFEKYWLDNNMAMMLAIYYVYKAQTLFILGKTQEAYDTLQLATPYAPTILSFTAFFDHNFYTSLLNLQKYETTKEQTVFEVVQTNQESMKVWAENCPENFLHKYQLVEAETARIKKKKWHIIVELYEQAIENAQQNGFIQDAALANELCAKYFLSIGKNKYASLHIVEAYQFYNQWGATAKLRQLEESYPEFLSIKEVAISSTRREATSFWTTVRSTTIQSTIDIDTILRANMSLSQQVRLHNLIEEMLHLLSINSGADKIIFLRREADQWFVEADQKHDENRVKKAIPFEKYSKLPQQVISYALRCKRFVLSDNISQDTTFQKDPYIQRKQTKSVLVIPVQRKNQLIALIYLENSLNTGVFHQKRYDLVNALATQLAISMENTLLYENLEHKVQEQTQAIQKAYQELHKKNENLVASVNYARNIQQALLPFHYHIEEALGKENFFIFFKPRDIVSGDFYYFAQVNEKIILSAVDCTGHGVPGAFMSMIGIAMMNEIIKANYITSPDTILNQLHSYIQLALQQQETNNQDGMDMSLITIDKATKQVHFAGAKNPLIYIQSKELTQLKGNRMNIGGITKRRGKMIKQLPRDFTKHTISIQEPTVFYLLTDGYPDQFGGAKRRKFQLKNLRKLFLEIHQEPCLQQYSTLEQTLNNWIEVGGEQQIDDITILGVKL